MGFKLKNIIRIISAPVTAPLAVTSKVAQQVGKITGGIPVVGQVTSVISGASRLPDDIVRKYAGFEGVDSRITSDRIAQGSRDALMFGGGLAGATLLAPALGVTSTAGSVGIGAASAKVLGGGKLDSSALSFLDPTGGLLSMGGLLGEQYGPQNISMLQPGDQGFIPEAGSAILPQQASQGVYKKPPDNTALIVAGIFTAATLILILRR